jgi:hypothetical protein
LGWVQGCPLCLHTCPCASCRKKHLADGAATGGEGEGDLVAAHPVPGRKAGKAAKKVGRSEETNSEDDEIDILGVSDDGEDRAPAQQPAPEGGTMSFISHACACAVNSHAITADLWEVKRVLACRMHAEDGAKEYLVRWKDTWLDRESLEVRVVLSRMCVRVCAMLNAPVLRMGAGR